MKSHSIIRTIYLYAFALLGLVLIVIASVRFLDMGLKAYVFTKADDQERIYDKKPAVPYAIERIGETESQYDVETVFTEKEKQAIRLMIEDYKEWKEKEEGIDPITSRRHRDASINLSMILVGLPLYLYHWRIIKRESKNKKA